MKPKQPPTEPLVQIQVRLPASIHQRVRADAANADRDMSYIVREIVRKHYASAARKVALVALVFAASIARAQPPCPCTVAMPAFAATLTEPLLACTHEPPGYLGGRFVRVVSATFHLAAAFTFGPGLYCAWQPPDPSAFATLMPTSQQEYQSCQHDLMHAATRQGVPCRAER